MKRRDNIHLTSPGNLTSTTYHGIIEQEIASATYRFPVSGCLNSHGHNTTLEFFSMHMGGITQPGFNGSVFQWVSLGGVINIVCLVDKKIVFNIPFEL